LSYLTIVTYKEEEFTTKRHEQTRKEEGGNELRENIRIKTGNIYSCIYSLLMLRYLHDYGVP